MSLWLFRALSQFFHIYPILNFKRIKNKTIEKDKVVSTSFTFIFLSLNDEGIICKCKNPEVLYPEPDLCINLKTSSATVY